jgi:hypothetical protein
MVVAILMPAEMLLIVLVVRLAILACIAKALHNNEALRIDCIGIYQRKKLVTDWDNFLEAWITHDEVAGSIRDNYILIIRYFKPGFEGGNFKRTILLDNTQDKSEEQILETIRRFYALSRNEVILLRLSLQIGGSE